MIKRPAEVLGGFRYFDDRGGVVSARQESNQTTHSCDSWIGVSVYSTSNLNGLEGNYSCPGALLCRSSREDTDASKRRRGGGQSASASIVVAARSTPVSPAGGVRPRPRVEATERPRPPWRGAPARAVATRLSPTALPPTPWPPGLPPTALPPVLWPPGSRRLAACQGSPLPHLPALTVSPRGWASGGGGGLTSSPLRRCRPSPRPTAARGRSLPASSSFVLTGADEGVSTLPHPNSESRGRTVGGGGGEVPPPLPLPETLVTSA